MSGFKEGGAEGPTEDWKRLFADLPQRPLKIPQIPQGILYLPDPKAVDAVADAQGIPECQLLYHNLADALRRVIQNLEIAKQSPSSENVEQVRRDIRAANKYGNEIVRKFPPSNIDTTA